MIAVVAPYGKGEVTAAAARVAAAVMAAGDQVRFVAPGKPVSGVHHAWDRRVLFAADAVAVARHSQGAEAVVHFTRDAPALAAARLAAPRARQVLVADWHSVSAQWPDLACYDRVVSPSAACHSAVAGSRAAKGGDPKRYRWVLFDAGLPQVPRRTAAGPVHACVVATPGVIDHWGSQLLYAVERVLDSVPSASVTLLSGKAWPDHDRRRLKAGEARYLGRLAHTPWHGALAASRDFHGADWAVLPATRAAFGITASAALRCGVPVVAFDVPPFSEHVRPDSGVLVKGPVRESESGAVTAVPCVESFSTACCKAFSGKVVAVATDHASSADFDAFWRSLLWPA